MIERTVRAQMTRFGIWMAAYAVVILVDGFLLPQPRRTDPIHIAGAIAPLIPLFGAGVAYVGAIRAMDEFGRRIHIEGMTTSFAGTVAITLTAGFLQWMAAVPTISLGWVWLIMAALYGIGAALARARYR